jgi:spoIIIJ-associated protein
MRSVDVFGKSIDEAVQRGLAELGVSPDQAEVEILVEPSPGFLGLIGSRQARVRVKERKSPAKFLQEYLQTILACLGINGSVEAATAEDRINIAIYGEKMGILIGKRGQTLDALQYLLNVVHHRKGNVDGTRVVLDVENYRNKREQTLRELANRLAKKVAAYRKAVVLEPMSAQERRIIHSALQDHSAVSTYSQGEEPYRKVVIAPK